MSRSIGAAAVLLLAGCTLPPPQPHPPTAKQCAARGQVLDYLGMFGNRTCVTKYADSGKACRGKSDCLGLCVVRLGTDETNGRDFGVGVETNGKCAPQDVLDGCYSTVEAGRVTESACVD
jgi:hypothetical protein